MQNLTAGVFCVEGMSCPGCELRIENRLKKLTGVITVEAKYTDATVNVSFNSALTELPQIADAIKGLDYTVRTMHEQITGTQHEKTTKNKSTWAAKNIGTVLIIVAFVLLARNIIDLDLSDGIPANMGYGILFVVGLVNSLHCIAMCGGINLSLCVSYRTKSDNGLSRLLPSVLYNSGRVISYTLIGGIVGAIGSVINISPRAQGLGAILAGSFMLLMGLNMLNVFPALRKITPRMPKIFGNKIYNQIGKSGPFVVGLLNGLMPCGPLQTVQIYALGTGSFVTGALSMFLFSIGTVPLMFGFGAVSSMMSDKFTAKMMRISAILVMALGCVMLIMGLSRRY